MEKKVLIESQEDNAMYKAVPMRQLFHPCKMIPDRDPAEAGKIDFSYEP
ncbi:MAG: hypothetical protein JWR50_4225 [Mucilaginibacter sp.]|nr:hypothetical protein [Mucilaginibacter sp.]